MKRLSVLHPIPWFLLLFGLYTSVKGRAAAPAPPSTHSTLLDVFSTRPDQAPSISNWFAITTICIDEGDRLAPDGQKNTARTYMHHTMANHAAYAARYGISYVPLTHSLLDLSHKDVRYHKLGWVERLLENFTWVFYTDCDSLFLDFCVDARRWPQQVEQQSGGENIDLILTGDKSWAMNSGQFMIKSSTWSYELLKRATYEPRNTHGCIGNDNAAFNWLLWSDCVGTHGDFRTWWNDTKTCEEMIQNSTHSEKLACAAMNTYAQDVPEALNRGPVFRVHFAGSQSKKQKLVERHMQLVHDTQECDHQGKASRDYLQTSKVSFG